PPPPPSRSHPLSLHDALPISLPTFAICSRASALTRTTSSMSCCRTVGSRKISHPVLTYRSFQATCLPSAHMGSPDGYGLTNWSRSEEHTSELQSRGHLVCRLL